ncbi:hypothetical protein KFK09_000225 [Dendrobium nobile]|uniref:Uncharacterized protein n=1 Tax=Dendrobium nobile TaxID=94219 RepID=A0A8T3C829_DENNO|nr:hypothetical protein KFK09_000225 [Dendrobium nobile]
MRWSGGGEGLKWWSGGVTASGGGPAEVRASSGGPAEVRTSSGGSAEQRRHASEHPKRQKSYFPYQPEILAPSIEIGIEGDKHVRSGFLIGRRAKGEEIFAGGDRRRRKRVGRLLVSSLPEGSIGVG